ncbi:acetylcholine receptor subunit alpha-like isoform X1 [Ruditapes philippinarum]|uniref:acetylcholine receptor subunit alpha-like isoform X1 n=1 Tax=Ruditapes philippinarum TaxID=129788 RepID=UPI00295AFE01|nr:acetylcholine receptor subunit alpha-like isoform X1 [Ruditapes philippinarum]
MFLKGSLTCIVVLYIQIVTAQYQDISHLLDDLQKGYRKHVLPTRKANSYVAVKVYPAIVRIDDLNSGKEELSSTISLSMRWTDDRLSWDPRDYGGVTEVYMPASAIWLPDITVHNTVSIPEPFTDQLVEVSSLGTVLYVNNVQARSYCPVDLEWFPRDQHTCDLIFSSWIYSSKKMMMEFMHVNTSTTDIPVLADTDPNIINLDSHKWQLRARKARAEINMLTYACCPEESYFQLKIAITMNRNVSFFRCITNMFIFPMLVISMIVPFQFLLPRKLSSRQTFGLFLLFGECLPLIVLSSEIPEHSSIPFIGIINILCIFVAMFALIASIIVSKISDTNRKHLPICLQNILRKTTSQKNKGNKGESNSTIDSRKEIDRNGLLPENHYIEMDVIDSSNERNGEMNICNGRTNEHNDLANSGNNIEVTDTILNNDRERINLILTKILRELKQKHSSTNNELIRKENELYLMLAAYIDKMFFYVFMVLSLIILIVLIIILLV